MLGSSLRRATLVCCGAAALFAVAALPVSAAAEAPPDIAGIYEVQGETLVQGQPDRFVITGKMVALK